jgi:Uma2 family endonuclease
VPDLAGWRRARLPKLPDAAWFELAPDWVCEVISPSTGRVDRAEKMPIYADWLVSHLWLIDPEQRTLEVYALEGNRGWLLLTTLQEDAEVRQPPFDALSFGLSGLWG